MKSDKKILNRKVKDIFSVAPMLDWTDRHCRYFLRLMSEKAYLYTEMITTGAILYGDMDRHLLFDPREHPVVLQLGGSHPEELAKCAKIAQAYGYNEINLNVGCPSSRVQSGLFGACLMKNPQLVAQCMSAMKDKVDIPVTVKTRTGVDDKDSYEDLYAFIEIVSNAGCDKFIIHARKAWLKGLSPKENREIPPLNYDVVKRLQRDFSSLHFILNGGIHDLAQVSKYLEDFAGVMLGRAIVRAPYMMIDIDQKFYGIEKKENLSREVILEYYIKYVEKQNAQGVPMGVLLRPLMGLYFGTEGAKQWRQKIAGKKLCFNL